MRHALRPQSRPSTAPSSLQQGPLQPHVSNFVTHLSQQGYSKTTTHAKVQLVLHLSRWLERKRLALQNLDEPLLGVFLAGRWKRRARGSGDRATLRLLLQLLGRSGIVPQAQPASASALDLIERDYQRFLLQERSLMPATVDQYRRVVRRFLSHWFSRGHLRLKQLSARHVIDFVSVDSAGRAARYAQLMTTALRSFLRFLLQQGQITNNLAAVIPSVAGGSSSELPRFLEAAEVEKLLQHCDRRTKTGQRDYAILLLLARLGLRAGEVAALRLEDIDWEAGQLCIRGKGPRLDRLPLLREVGQALAAYLHRGRPHCDSRRVFIHSRAPHVGFDHGASALCAIVRAALARAGLCPAHRGTHLLRHSLATRMLGQGASLAQIGQVLRHQKTDTTEIYAKVNLNALRALAEPWPGGAS
jgi:site-specific recombinase XerD